jgi:hypothetical protein
MLARWIGVKPIRSRGARDNESIRPRSQIKRRFFNDRKSPRWSSAKAPGASCVVRGLGAPFSHTYRLSLRSNLHHSPLIFLDLISLTGYQAQYQQLTTKKLVRGGLTNCHPKQKGLGQFQFCRVAHRRKSRVWLCSLND